ncbi:MAG: bifunctional methylenetetrahydrofolate dehydrogenase/methenyltetrahydrofolate cyclohydrolase FolD [Acidobacteriota bacterium]
MARTLDGKALAKEIRQEVATEVTRLRERNGVEPTLAVLLIGEHHASQIYVRNKARACEEAGIKSEVIRRDSGISSTDLHSLIDDLNRNPEVDGILVQLPLPEGLSAEQVTSWVDPAKDVDGLHPTNIGRLVRNEPGLVPCTPAGILRLLKRNDIPLLGRRAVVIGRSYLVGKPTAMLLLREHATVTLCHSRTRDLPRVAAEADILVVAIGRPAMVTEDFVRPGATVVDVGIHRLVTEEEVRNIFGSDPERLESFRNKGQILIGDVHPTRVPPVAGALSPVPGGVGPLTVAMLLSNTVTAMKRRRIADPA